jgi:hypothetical protein
MLLLMLMQCNDDKMSLSTLPYARTLLYGQELQLNSPLSVCLYSREQLSNLVIKSFLEQGWIKKLNNYSACLYAVCYI